MPRVTEYNGGALKGGRPTRPVLAQLLAEIAAVETELLDRLDMVLGERASGPGRTP